MHKEHVMKCSTRTFLVLSDNIHTTHDARTKYGHSQLHGEGGLYAHAHMCVSVYILFSFTRIKLEEYVLFTGF